MGTQMVTSGGPENRKADVARRVRGSDFPDGWRCLVEGAPPADDPAALVVRHERDGWSSGRCSASSSRPDPGRLRCEYSRRPWVPEPWTAVVLE